MPNPELLLTPAELRGRAADSGRRAEEARRLARDIEGRRVVVASRLEGSLARHTADTWSSRAAERSRTELQRVVDRNLWMADEDLRDTRIALDAKANTLDDTARADRRRAHLLEDQLAAALLFDPRPRLAKGG
jgi:hypothetical protein